MRTRAPLPLAVALVLLAVACGGGGGGGKADAKSAAQRCADRWNSNLKRLGGALSGVPAISSFSAHVGPVNGGCVLVVSRYVGGRTRCCIAFAAGPKPPTGRGRSDYTYIEPGSRRIEPSLRVPNARFDSHLRLTLK